MLRLQRYYSGASLIAMLVAAVLLTWVYRQASIQSIVALAERGNLMLARAVMTPLQPMLLQFLVAAENVAPHAGGAPPPLPAELAESIAALMHDRSIARIKIYNRHGVVVFSTWPSQVGDDLDHNPGFLSAIRGAVASGLVYRDSFNQFDGATEEDNLAQTYVPVRASPSDPIRGVFEIYTDVNRMVLLTERTEFIVMIGATLVLAALYGVLLLIVRRAARLIESQQRTIQERTQTLEMLSAQMLRSEESQKKKIAVELHEGLAQTLAALKLNVETGTRMHAERAAAMPPLESVISALQGAIQEVRTIATELRPSILDNLGLLPTLDWLCREFAQQYPAIPLERKVSVREDEVPAPLKIVIYRIIAAALPDVAQHANPPRIHLALWRERRELTLLIDDTPSHLLDKTSHPLPDFDRQVRSGLARMEELTTLSGGTFSASYRTKGGTTLRAVWTV
jgi:signal transduction histidine kinase